MKSSKTMINVSEAKTQLSRLLKRVEAGEELTIAKAGRPVARLVPIAAPGKRPLGLDRGKVWIADDCDAPLSDDILADFEGRD